MEKILFYGNEWEDFRAYAEFFSKMEMEGMEVAVATSNGTLIPMLSVGKLLVVNPETYYYDVYIYPDGKDPGFKGDKFSFSEFREVVA